MGSTTSKSERKDENETPKTETSGKPRQVKFEGNCSLPKAGDRIAFKRKRFKHLAIVESVDIEGRKLHMTEYTGQPTRCKSNAKGYKTETSFDKLEKGGPIYIVE